MKPIDEKTLDRIIEQITSQVLLSLQEDPAAKGSPGAAPLSAHDFTRHAQPVLSAGADRLASTLGVAPPDKSLAHTIDHTLLKPDATQDQIAQLCFEARKHRTPKAAIRQWPNHRSCRCPGRPASTGSMWVTVCA